MAGNRSNYKNDSKHQEHAFVRIERDLKAGRIASPVLLCGKEDYLTHHYRNVLVERLSSPATRQLDVSEFNRGNVDTAVIRGETDTLPLNSDRKIVVLDGFIDSRGRMPGAFEDSSIETKELLDIIGSVPDSCLLIITADSPNSLGDYSKQSSGKRIKQLKEAINKAGGSVYDFEPLDNDQLRGFVIKRFQNQGKKCTTEVLKRITYDTGYGSRYTTYDLYSLENDIRKMVAYSGDREVVTEEDLEATITVSPENNVFQMIDSISAGRTDRALVLLDKIFTDGESGFGILSNLVRQIEIMLMARELMSENNTMAQAVRYLEKEEKVNRFRAEKASKTASRFTVDQLRQMMLDAIAIEDNIKGGIMDSRLAMEYFIAQRLR